MRWIVSSSAGLTASRLSRRREKRSRAVSRAARRTSVDVDGVPRRARFRRRRTSRRRLALPAPATAGGACGPGSRACRGAGRGAGEARYPRGRIPSVGSISSWTPRSRSSPDLSSTASTRRVSRRDRLRPWKGRRRLQRGQDPPRRRAEVVDRLVDARPADRDAAPDAAPETRARSSTAAEPSSSGAVSERPGVSRRLPRRGRRGFSTCSGDSARERAAGTPDLWQHARVAHPSWQRRTLRRAKPRSSADGP